jgi:hypothetical protein
VNSQSKFHSRKAVEFSMRNKRNLMWEKQDLTEKEVENTRKNEKRVCLKSLRV